MCVYVCFPHKIMTEPRRGGFLNRKKRSGPGKHLKCLPGPEYLEHVLLINQIIYLSADNHFLNLVALTADEYTTFGICDTDALEVEILNRSLSL